MKNLISRFKKRYTIVTFIYLFIIICGIKEALAQETPEKFTNSQGMDFVLIPPGSFMMGSPMDEFQRKNNEKPHHVTITKGFYLQTTEITQEQWKNIMGENPSKFNRCPKCPVEFISWFDTQVFIQKLNQLEHTTKYRLPTEAEWEYACRAGSETAYSWGNDIDCSKASYSNNTLKSDKCVSYAKERGIKSDQPAPVKSYAPNAFGLYDMNGNVWEWCQDWYAPYNGGKEMNPTGPELGSDKVDKVRRGGSWYGVGQSCRCGNRNFSHFANRYQTTGFRLVKEVE
jgi:sulfatase modifying factor 1